ncbi:hypothetical protein [Paenibacillus odorifer]|uniref:hypothetical protein n=1 Tax=Paenibacillus odorifer TaxID=189426 RepID=UPI00096CA261|nr:hypothetical protein [Paenibacillus odorifer]OMD78148.1 hypothetical protein BSK50_10305 [Paenibacillus odorifer]
MIKLSRDIVSNLSSMYLKEIMDGITQKYYIESKKTVVTINPFTQQPVSSLLENGTGTLDTQLVKDLLISTFEDLTARYSDIDKYIKTCRFIFYSNFQINKELEREGKPKNNIERAKFRKHYLSVYQNEWIDNILGIHPQYSKSNSDFKRLIEDVAVKMNQVNEGVRSILKYEDMDADFRHHLLNQMGIEVCPYCNRQFITQYHVGTRLRTTADLDHFYPKSLFSLFSLSLFNFVPSCQICNSRFKLDKGVEILNPYQSGFDNEVYFSFSLKTQSTIDTLIGDNSFFDIDLIATGTGSGSVHIKNGIELFKLRQVYQSHKDYVRELLYKKNTYGKSYRTDLKNLLSELDLSDKEMNLFQYGFTMEQDDFGKRPLSKLAYDIIYRN